MADLTTGAHEGFNVGDLAAGANKRAAEVKEKIKKMNDSKEMNPGDMFETQFEMNMFTTAMDLSSNVVAACHACKQNAVRNAKG